MLGLLIVVAGTVLITTWRLARSNWHSGPSRVSCFYCPPAPGHAGRLVACLCDGRGARLGVAKGRHEPAAHRQEREYGMFEPRRRPFPRVGKSGAEVQCAFW